MSEAADNSVNPHYLDHVVATGRQYEVEASEDIMAGNGMKLLAKGARINADVRDRLLQHKLSKPLEDCVQVVDGVVPARFGPIAEELMGQHALLAALCTPKLAQQGLPQSLAKLRLSLPVQSLLTVYSEYQGDRLRHTVGVSLIAMALARHLLPGQVDHQRMLALAGLVHDVGELYIDPVYLRREETLSPEGWKHIVLHPVVGHRVLHKMLGAGPAVAEAVLMHHERLDGFGYPYGIAAERLSLDGQILGVAEWLMALIESGLSPLERASVATKLIPGEFSSELLEWVAASAGASPGMQQAREAPAPLELAVPRLERLATLLARFGALRGWIDAHIAEAGPELGQQLQSGAQRLLRIQRAFSSAGLDIAEPVVLLRQLAAVREPGMHLEVMLVLSELEWRLRELEREALLRGGLMGADDRAVMLEMVQRLTEGLGDAPV
ncbi:HD-GYP domain-containing protein [Roseateles toxinivorans]|uniref:HD domain-containing protein n=1 Tax=Roseateles toxinivorans TaxID=270368 RepID=A0A4R6QSP4_9BURK|nr:HD domain-containing phosphohydrolase [Roseateles toxinivorans]TDP73168.1 HD domain-containing protein [Roseateles toxinivorans]